MVMILMIQQIFNSTDETINIGRAGSGEGFQDHSCDAARKINGKQP